MDQPKRIGGTVLENARILSMAGGARYEAGSIAITHGRISAIGDAQLARDVAGPGADVVDVGGRVVLPGLVDTHVHLAAGVSSQQIVDCRDFYHPVKSVNDLLARLSAGAPEGSGDDVIFANGSPMQEFRLEEGRLPTATELDDVFPDRPVFLSFGAHVSVANHRALELIGISAATTDPAGGRIVRDDAGRPTGVLYERAQQPMRDLRVEPDFEAYKDAIEQALVEAATRGATQIHEMVSKPSEVRAYVELDRAHRLPIRVDLIIRVIEAHTPKWALMELGLAHGIGLGTRLSIGGIKMSIDGGFTGRAAAWYHVCGEPCGNHPLIRIEQDELDEVVAAYHDFGMRICVHAIGDRAMDMALDAFGKAQTARRADHLRHRVEHMGNWLVTDDRLRRAKAAGVTPVPNVAFLHFLGREAGLTLGDQRTEGSFPLRRLIDAGFAVTMAADGGIYWGVDPLRDAGAAVGRTTRDGLEIDADQAITNYEALQGATSAAAWLGEAERLLGTLEVGKLADIAVLSGDPLACDGAALTTMGVDATFVDGQVAWMSPALAATR